MMIFPARTSHLQAQLMILPMWFNNQTRKNMINKQGGSVTFSLIMRVTRGFTKQKQGILPRVGL
jgi:hypothetical protein